MNVYQKLFALVIVVITFGAGAFHILATFAPVLLDLLLLRDKELGSILMLSTIISIMVLVVLMARKNPIH